MQSRLSRDSALRPGAVAASYHGLQGSGQLLPRICGADGRTAESTRRRGRAQRAAARTGAGGIVLTHKEGHAWQDTDRAQRQAEGSPPPRPSGRRTPSPGTGRVKKGFPEAGGRYDDSSPSTLPTELASSASAERCGGLRNDCSARSQSVS
uniref:Uncharacterized protein n=1 Tax=Rangifer tarandus platyrhynchus TaxID=3082113 RepID=A0ACB0FKR5_RANTA|nr:unnamed protein product [Rangifer tarandus platyrhynchus]